MRVGIIGLSEGNGHPFSFAAIVNGFSDEGFADSGWPVIHGYLKARARDEFGFDGVRVTHAWTQYPDVTARLCRASLIDHAVDDPQDMLGKVDAVIIARDDWRSHLPLAKPFLDAGLPVFVDKPLSLDAQELQYFRGFLESGQLMSCSGLRFARELTGVADLGALKCIHGAVVLSWERYAVHLLDAVFASIESRPLEIARNPAAHESFTLVMNDGSVLALDAIGAGPKTFHLDFFGDRTHVHLDLHDNFAAFRATLGAFFEMCRRRRPPIAPADTLLAMQVLMAGTAAVPGGPRVAISDFAI
jgi:predicted dehydrogenase